ARLDALARLCLNQERPADAAQWLLARLEGAGESERVAIRIKLARAQVAASQDASAVDTLEKAFAEAPRNGEVRKLLLALYRRQEDLAALASTLSRAAEHIGDAPTILAYARESADIYRRLGQPELSVPVLRKGVSLAPNDRPLRGMLADGLLAAGELTEARELLEQLIKDYGRRRSSARAIVHLQLARVYHAQGEVQSAIEALETASRMDSANTEILRTLAELAHADGQYERAERAYRTLLVNVRRAAQSDTPPDFGPCEVLLELARIARERDDATRADELVESALEVLGSDDDELARLKRDLTERGEHELLRRVLQTRLDQAKPGSARADLLSDLASVLERALERPAEAFEMRLEAITSDPGAPPRYEPARQLAEQLGRMADYRECLAGLLAAARRDSDAHIRCELLLRLGEVSKLSEAFDEAADFYLQAEATGVRKVDVWRAQARLAAARGDRELQMVLLEQLVSLGADQAETRADAFYRMAEVHLADEPTVGEGVEALARALEESPHYERAGMILRRACEAHAPRNDLLDLYELVARKSTDQGMLLHYLERRASQSDGDVLATIAVAREGVELGVELYEWERAEALLMRAIALGE
ncbi:MAG: tetratricopeptide repeat protein, partial [Nannocystaceae bacterium]